LDRSYLLVLETAQIAVWPFLMMSDGCSPKQGGEFHHMHLRNPQLDCWWGPFRFDVKVRDIVGRWVLGWKVSISDVQIVVCLLFC
jgi:hypothetical protein